MSRNICSKNRPHAAGEKDGEENKDIEEHVSNPPGTNDNDNSLTFNNIYADTVHIPAYYTEQKQLKNRTASNVLRKTAGIPLAVVYGFGLYWIITTTILPQLHHKVVIATTNNKTLHSNTCPNFHGNLSNDNVTFKGLNDAVTSSNTTVHVTTEISHDKLTMYSLSGIMTCVGLASIFSRNTRCCMFLILPGLITVHSRTLLFTIIMSYLINYPLNSLRTNLKELFQAASCVYKSLVLALCQTLMEVDTVLKYLGNVLKSLKDKIDVIDKIFGPYVKIHINVNTNVTSIDIRELVQVSDMPEIMDQILHEIDYLLNWAHYAELVRKCLTIISIILLTVDAVRYLRNYYTDSSFDNTYIGHTVRKIWRRKKMCNMIPLRRWERNENLKLWNRPTFTLQEFNSSMRRSVPTFILFLLSSVVIATDYFFAHALEKINDDRDFNVTFAGIERNRSTVVDIPGFNISSAGCRITPVFTDTSHYTMILVLFCVSVTTCLLEIYISRIRSRMCNLFYPDKSEERADFLHYRIRAGRWKRSTDLKLIVRREVERRSKLKRFSPWVRFKGVVCGAHARRWVCPGCGGRWWGSGHERKEIGFQAGERLVKESICKDCYLDYRDDEDSE